jgi:hypothetical protein
MLAPKELRIFEEFVPRFDSFCIAFVGLPMLKF